MQRCPLISVIMPAYNVAPYLEMAVTSVMTQTYPAVELVLVDDGSTDDTHAIAAALHGRWPTRIQLLSQPNLGLAAARNSAIAAARGDFLALLDSDDAWDPEFLSAQMAILQARADIDIVTGNARFLGGPKSGAAVRPHPDSRPEPSLQEILTDEEAVFVMSVVRRRVVDTVGRFNPDFRTNEDFDYWLRAAHAGFRFARNSTPLGWYRVRSESLSADELRILRGAVRVLRAFEPRLVPGSPEWNALRWQLHRFLAAIESEAARRGLREQRMLSHADFLRAIVTLGGLRRAGVALLGRYAPWLFRPLHDAWRTMRYPSSASAASNNVAPYTAAALDRPGKQYWEEVWNHLEFPPDIDPRNESVWAYRDQQFHRFFREQLTGIARDARLLELGCARSAWLPYFAREFGYKVAGLDYSERGARESGERLAQGGIDAEVRCADLFDPPADWAGAFDVVVWFGVAEHFNDTAKAIRAAAVYLKPGGLLLTEVPNMVGVNGWIQRWINRPIYDIHVPLGAEELGLHHRDAGLRVLASKYLVPTDFGILNLENDPPGIRHWIKDRVLYALRLLTGCVWLIDRRIGPFTPGRLTSGFIVTAARKPAAAVHVVTDPQFLKYEPLRDAVGLSES